MLSENDKQAILNGAFGVTRTGQKAKFLGKNARSDHTWWCFYNDDGSVDDFKPFQSVFEYRENKQAHFDIIGLWQDKPDPFDLDRALKGECINYSGEPCYIYYSNRKTETHEYIVEASSGAFTLGGVREDELSKCMMWKEPKPQLSSNTLQLPKPLTDVPNDNDEVWHFFTTKGCHANCSELSIRGLKWGKDISKEAELEYLNHGRLYATREDVVKVIETITGKPYEDR
ncbi:hypothetical protein NYR66_02055 [Actinobacillus equuli subsp. haemolyticus]|uniref:hypothetical protein n=1 Tax=Actinobacillus equuli TaxID=718 RepID=UPI00244318AB|nr:hypothetical protein [Actinobacillus equuli]WGE81797.1 hypothetical protein NYR66_02055 [Actinobacillus equuli subsp. haemolyticus]